MTTFMILFITEFLGTDKWQEEQSTFSLILWLYIFSIINWAFFRVLLNLELAADESLKSFSNSSNNLNLFKLCLPAILAFCLNNLLVKYSPVIISILCFSVNIFFMSSWKSTFNPPKFISKQSNKFIPNFSIRGIDKA